MAIKRALLVYPGNQALYVVHLLLRGVIGNEEALLDVAEHEVARLNLEQLHAAESPLHGLKHALYLEIVESFRRDLFYHLEMIQQSRYRLARGLPLFELLA
jgi:hypothetical protein